MNTTAASSSSTINSMNFDFASGSRSSFHDSLQSDDHLQRLAQMAQGVGHNKSENSDDINSAHVDQSLYQSAAAAYVHQYGNWPNAYYQQFGQPMNPAAAAAAFTAWPPQCYAPPHWPNYGSFNFYYPLIFILYL